MRFPEARLIVSGACSEELAQGKDYRFLELSWTPMRRPHSKTLFSLCA